MGSSNRLFDRLGALGRPVASENGSGGANGAGRAGHAAPPPNDQVHRPEVGQSIPVFQNADSEMGGGAVQDHDIELTGATDPSAIPSERRGVSQPTGHIVHDLLKGLDVSFGIEASQLEREAITSAREFADKGLPRHDLEPAGHLEIEQALARRASQVFADWVRRVRGRMEGAIQAETERLGTHLVRLEQQVLRYRLLLDELRSTRRELAVAEAQDAQLEAEAAKLPKRRVSYGSHMGVVAYWLLMPCLVAADFVANVPVFNELLPASATADKALQNLEINASATPLFYGVKSFFGRLLIHPESTILAFSVILLLVYLGHQAGASIRTIVALHGSESKVSDELLLHHQRRPRLPAWASVVGVLALVGFLLAARHMIEPAARGRLAAAQGQLAGVSSQLAAAQTAGNAERVQELDIQRQQLEVDVNSLRARHDYTQIVSGANVPIAILNLVLALCAGIAAYQHQSEVLEIEPLRTPTAAAIRARYVAARTAVEELRGAICTLTAQFDQGSSRIQHLLDARPLQDADGKTARLKRVIPSFRAENARARGLDTRDVKAFAREAPEVIPQLDIDTPLHVPETLPRALERYSDISAQFETLERDREAATEVAA